MALTLPTYDEIVQSLADALVRGLQARVNGQPVLPNVSAGTANRALIEAVALIADALYGKLELTDQGLRLRTATGEDLDDLVALLGVVRTAGTAATVPVKMARQTVTGSDVIIPTGIRVLARDSTGAPSIVFLTIQDPARPAGQAGIIAGGSAAGWVFAQAQLTGAASNVAAGQIAQLGDPIAGVDTVANPAVGTPPAPTVTPTGGASTTYQYRIVANGVTGQTVPSDIGQTTVGPTVLDGTHYNDLAWPAVVDAVSYALLRNIGTVLAPVWAYLTTVSGLTYRDTGGATPDTTYAVPTANTTNAATGGTDDEGDTALRKRAPDALAVAARATDDAIKGAVAAVSGVARVFTVDAVVGGTPPPGTFQLRYTTTSGGALSTSGQAALAAIVGQVKALGVVPDLARLVPVPVAVAYTVTKAAGVTDGSSLVPAINAAIITYLAGLDLGAPVRFSQVVAAILSVSGTGAVTALTLTPQGGSPYSFADVPGVAGTLYQAGAITATVM